MELFLCENVTQRAQAYALLAFAARRRWGMEKLPAIARQEGGKPFFPDCPDRCFSLSHSGQFALCALDEQAVGADIERLRPHPDSLAQRICGPEELAWLAARPERERALCILWTGKESRVKYTGTGLTVPIRAIAAPLPPRTELDGLYFYRLSAPEYVLCVCAHGEPEKVTRVRAEELSAENAPNA